jgi:hypothetical protein
MRRAIVLLIVSLVFGALLYACIGPPVCSSADRISTEEQARQFAVTYLRNNKAFWDDAGIKSQEEIDEIVSRGGDGPVLSRGSHDHYLFEHQHKWSMYFKLYIPKRLNYDYWVFFNECGRNVVAEKNWLRNGN